MSEAHTEQPTTTPDGPILVAVDFSIHSAAALRWALGEAVVHNCNVVVVHVVNDPGAAPGYYLEPEGAGDEPVALSRMDERAAAMLQGFLAPFEAEAGGILDSVLVSGLPSTRILEVAEAQGARQIVVGSRGRTGLFPGMLGSKALRVAQLAELPVTIVKEATT